ncbi:P-loop containing nucleoside triphosphate hydrolase protein [Hysterangium stoloniferum]|nr:P-loop containing nucleoside triphosphate hydrolase protein [Hysterangium stoloniferum]
MDPVPSITVAVRLRPPTPWESARLPEAPTFDDTTFRGEGNLLTPRRITNSPLSHILRVTDKRLLVFDPPDEDTARAFKERGFLPPGTKRYKDRRFLFDRVFDMDAQQGDVFEETTKPLLGGLFDGYNATVFAYGATGCGKTHTISGTDSDPGIIYLTMAELFQLIEDKKEDIKVDVSVTFLEIYNEEIRDLLTEPGSCGPKGGLVIREDKSVKVSNLTELRPISAEEVKQIVLAGNARRTQSPTHANETSSRSHAVLQIHLTTSPRTADTSELYKMATLSIIDLAGSERASATKNMGERMVEGANINKSLLALGNCINALCESGGRKAHVPYRNSKLTRLLKFSLGGNCKTVMIVCVAPASNHFDDTHNTLVYAERAKKIKTKAVTANFINVDRHVGQYVEAINRLNAEVADLKAKLAGKAGAEAEITRRKRVECKTEVERAKVDIQAKLEQTRGSIADGALCQGGISVASARLQAIRTRLMQVDAHKLEDCLSTDVAAERELLLSLAESEENILRLDSPLHIRLRKSDNTSNMFDAMLRAVCERRHDKLDEVSIDNIALNAQVKKIEMDRIKAEAESSVLKSTIESQAALIVTFAGILARSTAMMKDGGDALLTKTPDASDPVHTVGTSLKRVAGGNDSVLASLVNHSTSFYSSSALTSSPSSFSAQSTPQVLLDTASVSSNRRSKRISSLTGSPRRLKSPRKSAVTRTTLTSSRWGTAREKEKKSLRWKDEAGQGSLDDASSGSSADPETSLSRLGGSESDWEDEKPEDPPIPTIVLPSSVPSDKAKRPRSSRLDPSYLKANKASVALGSLTEDDECASTPVSSRRPMPFSDRGNQLNNDTSFGLMLPKGKSVSATPRMPSTVNKAGRRRSQIGPVRSDKSSRRRSSLIPLPSPPHGKASLHGGARRVPIESIRSPAKRVKRSSLLGAPRVSTSMRALRPSVTPSAPSVVDQNTSMAAPGGKPTWK